MFPSDNSHLLEEQPAESIVHFDKRQIDTVIDGYHVTMRFLERTDSSALDNVRNILKSSYLNSLSN